jgi:hypothetical protein
MLEMLLEPLIYNHCGAHAEETLWAFNNLPHEKEVLIDETTKEAIGVVAYFYLERLPYDMIVLIHKDNKPSLSQWKFIKKKLQQRDKEIRIQLLDNIERISQVASHYGAKLDGDVLVFPKDK